MASSGNRKNTSASAGKKRVIGIFLAVAAAFLLLIWLHNNKLADPQEELLKKVLSTAFILLGAVIFLVGYDKLVVLPQELFQNRHLIWKLAKNDFKKRYAGSYMGVLWALVQPLVTVGMYYIVFDRIFPSQRSSGSDIPFVLFLTAGLVPWFYFNEALNGGTSALTEYNYLVKKVVFKISILPIIKIVSAGFVHVFFTGILLVLGCIYGYYPTVYTIQLLYYALCLFIFTLALSYTTCAVCVFFKDLTQIIVILLQMGMWATPIMWDINSLNNETLKSILKINPMVYIVNGYRSAVYERQWFFEDFFSTMYFWIITVLLFCFGALVFKRLKPHFADVL